MSQVQLETPTIDWQAVRAQFPNLQVEVHGKPLIYFDNAATAQRPQAVIDAVNHYYTRINANVHRGVHQLSVQATEAMEEAREALRRFINARSTRETVFVRGTTEAINLVANSFVRPRLKPGDEIVISHMEHHANIVPWQLLCEQTGAVLRVAPVLADGSLDMEALAALLDSGRVQFCAVVHVSNSLGTINPVAEIIDMAHARDIPVLLDGAQAVPHEKVDVQTLDCDFYCFSGHKMYGPTGIGVLYGKEAHLEAMPPWQGGGEMIATVSFEKTTYAELPMKFEAGTPHIAGAIGMKAAVAFMESIGVEHMARREAELLDYANRTVASLPGFRTIGSAPHKAAVLSFVLEDIHPHDVGTILDHFGIAIRTGHHCTMPILKHFGVPGTARASFACYNTEAEIDRLAEGLERAREMFL